MAAPQVNHPAYIIYRDVLPGEPYDATSPLSFFPPKGSDELFDALREAFPLLKTHSERMRDAIIQFLLEERQGEQFELSPATTMESSQLTWPSASSGSGSASNFSSPDLLNFATPASFSNSPQIDKPSTTTSSQPSPPSLDQMTGVFSLSSNPQPKQRVRRKMTEAEKVEYRKRRIVKACEKCAKRKRKCPHNQTEMKTIPTPSTKSTSPLSASPAEPSGQKPDKPYFSPAFDESFDPTAFGSFGDFNMFDDPLPEVSVDDFFHFEHFEDTSTLFAGINHDASGRAQQQRQNNAPAFTSRDTGTDEADSYAVYSRHVAESESAKGQTQLPSDLATGLQESQIHNQRHPSQQAAVRDPRTGGSLSEETLSADPAERQSRHMKNVHRSDSDVPRHNLPINSTGGSLDDTLLSESTYLSDRHRHRARPPRSSSDQEIALSSTSVSTLSESSALRTATLQGRRTETRVLQEQMADSGEGEKRQGSLGEGIRRPNSLATELFMLRRRLPQTQVRHTESHVHREGTLSVPAQLKPGKPTSRSHQSPEQLSAQANGGAYLRLGSESIEPTHTSRRTYRGGRAEVRDAALGQDVAFVSAAPSSTDVHEDRLSDHMRYRDHHGRLQIQAQGHGLLQLVCALGAFMLLASFSPSISALGLALILTKQLTEPAGNSEGIVQCTAKNSSWLSAFARKDTADDIGFRVLKARQYLRCSGSQVGVSLFESGLGAWLMGLMYPFKLSPLSFAVV